MDTIPTEFDKYVLGNIQKNCIDAIESTIAVIHDLITKYSGPNILAQSG
jgi:hypothetical protein